MKRALAYFLRSYLGLYVLLAGVTLVTSLLEGCTLAAFFPVFVSILQPESVGQVTGLSGVMAVIAHALPWKDLVISSAVLVAGFMLCKSLMIFVRDAMLAYASGRVLYDLKHEMVTRYAQMSYESFTSHKQGTLLYHALTAPGSVALLLHRIPQLVAESLKILVIGAVLFLTFPAMTMVLALVALIYYGFTRYLSKTVAYDTGVGRSAAQAEQTETAHQLFDGMRHILVYGTARYWLEKFDVANRTYAQLYTRYLTWLAVPRNVVEMVFVFLMAGSVIIGRLYYASSFMGWLPAIGLFTMAFIQLLPSLTAVGRLLMDIREAQPDLERLYGVVTQHGSTSRNGSRRFDTLQHGVTFGQVSFTYAGRKPVLQDITATCARGQITAIVGASGAGKTTLINLILGLCEPSAGHVLLDGVALTEYQLQTWLQRVGFVGQDTFVFHGSIADNILFGRDGYTLEHIMEAAKKAHLHEFIAQLPEGYETLVGDRGAKLSGGQQQRLAIARAMLGSPDVLILDEATSALDAASERLVQQTIAEVAQGRTVILIAHGEQMMAMADHTIVLEHGRVVEEGAWQTLRYHRAMPAAFAAEVRA